MKLTKEEVYDRITSERNYQDSLPHHWTEQDESHSIADWLTFMEYRINKAKEAIYYLKPEDALKEVRVITALGVACMQFRGAKERL